MDRETHLKRLIRRTNGSLSFISLVLIPFFSLCSSENKNSRKCSACRLVEHIWGGCPLVWEPMVHCKCGKGSFPDCSVACEKCNQRGHSQDTLSQPMRVGFVVRFTRPELDHAATQERVKILRAAMEPTARAKKALAKANKGRLAQLVPGAGSHL